MPERFHFYQINMYLARRTCLLLGETLEKIDIVP